MLLLVLDGHARAREDGQERAGHDGRRVGRRLRVGDGSEGSVARALPRGVELEQLVHSRLGRLEEGRLADARRDDTQ